MVFNKNNKKEISAIEDLIKSKIYVNPRRFEELSKLKDDIWNRPVESIVEPSTLLCFNLSPEVEAKLRSLDGYSLQVEHISEDQADPSHKENRKRFLKVFAGKRLEEARVCAIIHELGSQEEQLTLLDRRVIALSLLNKLPVLVLATGVPDALPTASAATGSTWPVFFVPHPNEDMRPVCEWLAEELPRVRALSAAIEADLQARVAHLAKVNAPLHFLSRASVALVPFGVMAVNFLGILRLMANMLQAVGMRGDTSANKAIGLLGAKNAALVTAIDSTGDIYSFAVFATVLADLQGLGLVEAAAAMDVLDGLMLGSISVVTGAVSALGAYLSRPIVVRSAAEFLASLQTIHVLNPAMRRAQERRDRGGGSKGRKGRRRKGGARGATEQEELRGLIQGSGGGGLTRSGAGAAAVAAAAEEALAAAGVQEEADAGLGPRAGKDRPGDEGCDSASNSLEDGSDKQDEDEDEEEQEEDSGGEELGEDRSCVDVAGSIGEGGGTASDSTCNGAGDQVPRTLPRAEKKKQALAQRQAAREAKAAAKVAAKAAKEATKAEKAAAKADKAAAKAAAEAAKKAARLEEREQKRQEKHLQQERKAADKAAAKLTAKGRGALQLGAALLNDADGGGGPAERMFSAAGKASTAGDGEAAGAESRKSSSSGGDAGESGSEGSGDAGEGEEGLQERVEAALSREARMGLDEETCRALMNFLDLPDEEVYVSAEEAPQIPSNGQGHI